MTDLPIRIFEKYDIPVPRYTSYPTAVQFKSLSSSEYKTKLKLLDQKKKNISIYIHIPFCRSMCLFCGCSVILNRKGDKQQKYVDCLLQEIELLGTFLKKKHFLKQLHFGGGTPTNLTESQFSEIVAALKKHIIFSDKIEMSIEIDPRNIIKDCGKKLSFLKQLGFNRVSFGVQDTDLRVQEAVKRRQTKQMTIQTFSWAKDLGFEGINLDLIYGLPRQTKETFKKTVESILAMRPDRIALFSYAKVPWLKPHQKAIKEAELPSQSEKFTIYRYARKAFVENGYMPIGMDHFALPDDPLSKAFLTKSLDRNFQGYSLSVSSDMIGLGMSSIGYVQGGYFQNERDLEAYQERVLKKDLPIFRGYILSEDDHIHKWVINKLMCNFKIDKHEFNRVFNRSFDQYFSNLEQKIKALEVEGLIYFDDMGFVATNQGELFIRIVASIFDQYYECRLNQYSRSV